MYALATFPSLTLLTIVLMLGGFHWDHRSFLTVALILAAPVSGFFWFTRKTESGVYPVGKERLPVAFIMAAPCILLYGAALVSAVIHGPGTFCF